jgi:hypothetical protein
MNIGCCADDSHIESRYDFLKFKNSLHKIKVNRVWESNVVKPSFKVLIWDHWICMLN